MTSVGVGGQVGPRTIGSAPPVGHAYVSRLAPPGVKYARVALSLPPAVRHPMHEFVVDRDGYEASSLVGSTVVEGYHAAVFHVEGWPPDPYKAALDAVETIREYELSTQADGTFSVYVHERLRESDAQLVDSFGQAGLVTWLPLRYEADGTMRITLVGPSETLQRALDEIPEGIGVDLRDIGAYHARRIGGSRTLTDRQAEAVGAAVDLGYYEDPRDASVADVAERLDCSPSTAAEHLRRAERTVMAARVDGST